MEIEEPVVLARLPRPLQENSQHKYGHVYGFSAGQRRKRHEVSVAIDGNSVNIYEVEHGSIRASYAIPPAASFVCSPASLRVKTGKHTFTRYTYVATRRPGQQRLDCFEERFDNDLSQDVTSSCVATNAGNVAYLEIISTPRTTGADEHSISVLHHNGILRQYTSGLGKEEVAHQLVELDPTARCHDILATRWLSFEDVRNSTLKHRPDILAYADPASSFVTVLYRQKSGLAFTAHVGVWQIPLTRPNTSSSQNLAITAIVTYNLPEVQLWSQEVDLECSFNPKATSLLVTGVKGVANFDFSSYAPRLTWEQNIPDHGLSSIRINSSFVATSSTTSLTVNETKYCSSRATLDLTRIGKKRKRETETQSAATRGFVKIIGYFRELGKLVTVRRSHLLSFEISGAQKEAMLIDSIGSCALDTPRAKQTVTSELEIGIVDDLTGLSSKHWTTLQQKMTSAAEAGDAAIFEAAALEAIHDPDSVDRLSDRQIKYLISKIFQWTANGTDDREGELLQGQRSLKVAIPAFTVLSLLVDHGALIRHTVQHALQATPQPGKFDRVKAGMIPAALIEADNTLVLLKGLLDTKEYLDAKELAAIVALLVKLVLSESDANKSANVYQELLQRGDPMDAEDESDEERTQEKSFVQAKYSENKLEHASLTRRLVEALENFARFGAAVVAELLKANLDRTEITTLIQILRQQLFESQHSTSIAQEVYPSPPSTTNSSHEERISETVLSLDATSRILLGSIDALGSVGFVFDGNEDDFLAQMIPELKSETALATQGLEEASYLRGILRETMRYAQSTDKDAFGDGTLPLSEDTASFVQKPGTIITLYAEPTIDQGDIETKSGLLPLSLRAENTISLTRMRKGGGQPKDRSLREVREIENRNKGRYSFERLVL